MQIDSEETTKDVKETTEAKPEEASKQETTETKPEEAIEEKPKKLIIEVIQEKENLFLDRYEKRFRVLHNKEATPKMRDIKHNLAEVFKIDLDKIVVKDYITKTGKNTSVGEAHIYKEK